MPPLRSGPIRFVGGSHHNDHHDVGRWHTWLRLMPKRDDDASVEPRSLAWLFETEDYELRKLWFKSDGPHDEPTIYYEYHLRGADYDHAFDLTKEAAAAARVALKPAFERCMFEIATRLNFLFGVRARRRPSV